MRAVRIYYFDVKKTAKFSELPGIVHAYLDKEGLTAGRFLYCLEEIDFLNDSMEHDEITPTGRLFNKYLITSCACAHAVKDCPKLGVIKRIPSPKEARLYNKLQVSNVIEDTECTEDDIVPYLKRYERTYGRMDTSFFYYDVNFFGKTIPFLRDRSRLNSKLFLERDDPCLAEQIYGSGISICRTALRETGLELSIDILHNGVLHDPEPYFRSMCELLPGARYRTQLRVFLSDAEKAETAALGKQAEPVLEECRGYLKERLPSKDKQTLSMPNYNIAPLLKKLAKKSGYSYSYKSYGFYESTKRLPHGHILKLNLISGPSHYDTKMGLYIEGIGFSQRLAAVMETPNNQEELDTWLCYVFDVLADFEKKHAASLDSLYKPTPDWYKDVN